MFARIGPPLVVVLATVGDSPATPPPDPKPEPVCTADQLKHIKQFDCPAETKRVVACPNNLVIDMPGNPDLNNAVQQWCAPSNVPSRYDVGVAPLGGGLARGPYVVWYANGQKAHEGRFPMRGVWTKWHSNGVKASVKDYGDGGLRGRTTEWYPNGKKAFTGSYDRDKRVGKWTWWTDDGVISETGTFVADQEEGRWTRYYPDGKPKSEWSYRRGLKHGRYTHWYPNGQKQVAGECRDERLQGRFRRWAPDGTNILDKIERGSAPCFDS